MREEDLDKIFREGLSNRNVDFNMESWRKMEQMLPPEPQTGGYFVKRTAAVIGALLILSASIFVWQYGTDSAEMAEQSAIENLDQSNTNNSSNAKNASNGDATDPTSPSVTANAAESAISDENGTTESASSEIAGGVNAGGAANEGGSNQSDDYSSTDVLRSATPMAYNNSRNGSNGSNSNASSSNPNSLANAVAFEEVQDDASSNINEDVVVTGYAFTEIKGINELDPLLEDQMEDTKVIRVKEGRLPQPQRNLFGLIGGANLQTSLTGDKGSVKASEFFGLTYERFLSGGFSLRANLLYSARNNVNQSKLHTEKVYDFGSRTEQTLVQCERLMSLELPVMGAYNMGRHTVALGASVNFLLSGYNQVTTRYTNQTESWNEQSMQYGYINGFRKVDVALVAGYEYTLSPNLNLGARLNYGLMDMTDNNYYQSDSFDNNVQFRVYLKFTPFRF